MKKITCELCGSNEFVKQGDFFVCGHCGTKYTKESLQDVLKIDVNVDVNDKHWEEQKEKEMSEAEQLDYEIRLLVEYKPIYDNWINSKMSDGAYVFLFCFGIFLLIPFFIELFILGISKALSRHLYEFFIIIAVVLFLIKGSWETSKRRELASVKYYSLKNKIRLIPCQFWHEGYVVRDYYENWGARTQKDLLGHLQEHFRKPDVVYQTHYIKY